MYDTELPILTRNQLGFLTGLVGEMNKAQAHLNEAVRSLIASGKREFRLPTLATYSVVFEETTWVVNFEPYPNAPRKMRLKVSCRNGNFSPLLRVLVAMVVHDANSLQGNNLVLFEDGFTCNIAAIREDVMRAFTGPRSHYPASRSA